MSIECEGANRRGFSRLSCSSSRAEFRRRASFFIDRKYDIYKVLFYKM